MTFCGRCGFAGSARDRADHCRDVAECRARLALEQLGRPRSSGCRWLEWPCPCRCHAPAHDPPLAAPPGGD